MVPHPVRARAYLALVDAREREGLALELQRAGWETVSAPVPGPQACLAAGPFEVVFADADQDGEGLVARLSDESPAPAVVLVSSFGTVRDAVSAVQQGAFDFVVRPASNEQLLLCAERAREQLNLRAENQRLRRSVTERFELGRFVTRDPRTRRALELIERVADTRATVLIEGESGTGKTLLARALHERSGRSAGPFVVVNCGALPDTLLESELFGHARGAFTGALRDRPGRFEEADGGTLFLDEIATASSDLQVKLLRAVQERVVERVGSNDAIEVDVRFVFASNRDLAAEVRAGRFREDLYWRIHVVALSLPPLRERSGDVALLAQGFLDRFAAEYERGTLTFHPATLAQLCRSPWPGNVRQLENTVERAVLVARGTELLPADLTNELTHPLQSLEPPAPGVRYGPFDVDETPPALREALEGPERSILLQALELCGWNRQATASMLGINRTTLFNKMHKYDLFALDRAAAPSTREAG